MISSAEQILRIYNAKPKPRRRGNKEAHSSRKSKAPLRSVERMLEPRRSEKKRLGSLDRLFDRQCSSRHLSPLKLSPEGMSLSGGMIDGMERLQELMTKSNQARSSRLNVQIQMLKLGVSELVAGGKLTSVTELDDLHIEDMVPPVRGDWNPAEVLLNKYETQMESRLKVLRPEAQ